MLIDGIEFNYTVKSTDIDTAHLVVEYDPVDENLMPYTLNVPFIEFREWTMNKKGEQVEVNPDKSFQDHLEYSIKCAAPISQWRRQKLLLSNL